MSPWAAAIPVVLRAGRSHPLHVVDADIPLRAFYFSTGADATHGR